MEEKILFSKKYDKIKYKPKDEELNMIKEHIPSFRALLDVIIEDTVYIHIPEKENMVYRFVQDAIDFSDEYQIDIEVAEIFDGIAVHFSFDELGIFTNLKEVMTKADDILIIHNANGHDITLTLTLQIQKLYQNPK